MKKIRFYLKACLNFARTYNPCIGTFRLVLTLLLLSGCLFSCGNDDKTSDSPAFIEVPEEPTEHEKELSETAEATSLMLSKAIRLKSLIQEKETYSSSVYVYSKTVSKYQDNPQKLAARIALLGFTEVYLSTPQKSLQGTDPEGYQWLKTFIAAAHRYEITVYALRLSDTRLYVDSNLLYNETGWIDQYNHSVVANEKIDGISADLEPHVLKKDGESTPSGLDIFWDSTSNYGIGKENDQLLERTLNLLHIAREEIAPLRLNEAISFLYQPKINEKKLSFGSTPQFLQYCHSVIVMAYYYKKETIWNRSKPILTAAGNTSNQSVSICVKTSLNTYGDNGDTNTSLQPQGWDYLLETIKYIYDNGKSYSCFRGMDFFEYEGLETMWEWINDKN